MSDWSKWLDELEKAAVQIELLSGGGEECLMSVQTGLVREIVQGYRLLAEAVEAKAVLDEAVAEYVKARKSPLQVDAERTNALGQRGFEMQNRYHQAQEKALAHLRGVGRD